MRIFMIFIFLYLVAGQANAIDSVGTPGSKYGKVEIDKNKVSGGVGQANDILSDPKARNPGELDAELGGYLNQSKAGMTNDMKSLTGENDGIIWNLLGDRNIDAKIGCLGNTKIATITFSGSQGVNMNINLETGGNTSITNIRGVCAGGFTVCDKAVNNSLCSNSISRMPEASKQSHSCNVFPDNACRDWQLAFLNNKLLFDPIGDTCKNINIVNDEIYNTLTSQLSTALSKAGLPVGKIERKGNTSVIYSMKSENCVSGSFGSGLTNIEDLTSLYNPKATTMPDSADAMKDAATDNESIFNLVQKGNTIEFDGASIGKPAFNKCEINNLVNINVSSAEKRDTFSGSYKLCTDHYIKSRVRRVGSQVVVEFKGGNGIDNMQGCYSWVGSDVAKNNDGWFSVYSVSAPATLKEARLTYSVPPVAGCEDGNGSSSLNGEDNNNLICAGGGIQYPTIMWNLELIYSDDKIDASLSVADGCQSLEDNEDCVINKESVCDNEKNNCIETVKDAKKLDVTINLGCYEVVSGIYKINVCPTGKSFKVSGALGNIELPSKDGLGWSYIKREYRCIPKPSGLDDTSKGLDDIFNIIGDGTSGVALPVSCYVQFCTVGKRYDTNNIYGDGSTNVSIGNSASVSDTIKQCEAVSVSGGLKFRCPVENGETVKEKCSCDNKDQLITNLSEVLVGFAMAEELKKYLNCDNSTQDNKTK